MRKLKLRTGNRSGRAKGMNNLEKRYAAYLQSLLIAGQIHWWGFEAIKLRLADNTHSEIDWAIITNDGALIMDDTKAGVLDRKTGKYKPRWTDRSKAKFKIAAEMYPFIIFRSVHEAGGPGRWVWIEYNKDKE